MVRVACSPDVDPRERVGDGERQVVFDLRCACKPEWVLKVCPSRDAAMDVWREHVRNPLPPKRPEPPPRRRRYDDDVDSRDEGSPRPERRERRRERR